MEYVQELLKEAWPRQRVDQLRVLAWTLLTFSFFGLLYEWVTGRPLSAILGLIMVVGLWLELREVPFFGLSDSTLELLHLERVSTRIDARELHKKSSIVTRRKSEAERHYLDMKRMAIGISTFLSAVFLTGAVYYFVPNPAWQQLCFLLIISASLQIAAYGHSRNLLYLITAISYTILSMGTAPLFSLLAILLLSGFLILYAWCQANWSLIFLVVSGFYLSTMSWMTSSLDAGIRDHLTKISGAEALILGYLGCSLLFVFKRRKVQERQWVRAIIMGNTLAFSVSITWLAHMLVPRYAWLVYSIVLLIASAQALLAWQYNGRQSYAKYYALAALVAVLLTGAPYLSPSLVALVWFIVSIVLVTAGFTMESYSVRMAGLFTLIGTVFYYLLFTLPASQVGMIPFILRDRFWIGILLVSFVAVTGVWFNQLHARGPEKRYRSLIVGSLFCASAFILFCITLVELLTRSL